MGSSQYTWNSQFWENEKSDYQKKVLFRIINILTPPPDNEISWLHLLVSRKSKVSSKIRAPLQIGPLTVLEVVTEGSHFSSAATQLAFQLNIHKIRN
jgi:hypothetical protein